MRESWKLLYGSVAGTSHESRKEPCEDYALGRVPIIAGSPVLVAACADGAGSATHGATGAKLACLTLFHCACASLENGLPVSEIRDHHVRQWHEEARRRLSLEACLFNLELRDLACTLLTAIVGEHAAVFSQIGDGAIVFPDAGSYHTAFWPQRGEYANVTFFLTGTDWAEQLAIRAVDKQISEVALFTDGLQSLVLHEASQSVHAPFFDPLFKSLRDATDAEELDTPLQQFLQSQRVNDRTDDDKTLMLATRRSP